MEQADEKVQIASQIYEMVRTASKLSSQSLNSTIHGIEICAKQRRILGSSNKLMQAIV